MKQAKELARAYRAFDGQVTFYMLPWNTILFSVVTDKLEKLLGKKASEFDAIERFFPAAESITVDIEFGDDLTPEVQGLQLYWQSRNGDAAKNFDAYQRYLSDDVFIQWFTAYGETRDLSLKGAAVEKPTGDDDPKKKSRMSKK